MKIDIRLLGYFLAVATERSFTRGAARLHMAQPPLSKRIQELEAALGAPLFLRDSRPLVLTPAGQLLFEQATQVMHRMAQLETTMRRFITADNPRFVFGVVPSALYAGLSDLIRTFRQMMPDLDVSISELDPPQQVIALRDGRINIGFDRIVIDEPDLHHRVLRTEPLVVALPRDHPLLLRGDAVGLAEIAAIPLILYPRDPRPSYVDIVLSAFAAHGLHPATVQDVQEMQTALLMVAAGDCACIVPQSVQTVGRPDIGFAAINEQVTVPLLVRYRAGDQSPVLQTLFAAIAALYGPT